MLSSLIVIHLLCENSFSSVFISPISCILLWICLGPDDAADMGFSSPLTPITPCSFMALL